MSTASMAVHLGADHAEGAVRRRADGVRQRSIEAGPSGAAVELGVRREQRLIAGGAEERTSAVLVVERAGAGRLGPVLAQNLILIAVQLLAPLGVRLRYLEHLARCLVGAGRAGAESRAEAGDGRRQEFTPFHAASCECLSIIPHWGNT